MDGAGRAAQHRALAAPASRRERARAVRQHGAGLRLDIAPLRPEGAGAHRGVAGVAHRHRGAAYGDHLLSARAIRLLYAAVFALCAIVRPAGGAALAAGAPTFPRLLGMNIGAKNYDDPSYQRELARLDVVILGFYKGWTPANVHARNSTQEMRKVVVALKTVNPRLLVGQYTVLNETFDDAADVATADLREKLTESGWWLKDGSGRKVQWTAAHKAWDINYSQWARP